MADSLIEYVSLTGRLGPDRLQRLTAKDCAQIFGQPTGAVDELMTLFAASLNNLGEWLANNNGVAGVIERADGSAERLAEHLTEMPFYRDVASFDGSPVAFYKRAQITSADLARRIRPNLFGDLHRLTAFADNLVPHTLRMLGVIALEPELASAIDAGVLLDHGGSAEVEIRAAGVVCVERLATATGTAAMDVDGYLWDRGQDPAIKRVRRHRSRCVFY